MGIDLLDAMAREGFEEVIALHDRRSGLRGVLAIHDSSPGRAFGGTRRWSYPGEDDGLRDCLRLARAMTEKCALVDVPAGGAKAVLLDAPDVDWPAAYAFVGDLVERLGGRFYTGPDIGTGSRELGWIAARTRYVTDPGPRGPGLLADSTVEGVFAGIATALRFLDGEEDWPRRRVVIQGLGEVGRGLAQRLVEQGARVVAAEVIPERARAVEQELEIEIADPATELGQECDVFAPCAMGGILHDLSISRLACRVIAGGANNLLVRPEHGDRLHERGILYAPDFVINSGALVRGATFHLEGRTLAPEVIGERIGRSLLAILERSREERLSPARVALSLAEERIARRRAGA